jgi:hypothetical protein
VRNLQKNNHHHSFTFLLCFKWVILFFVLLIDTWHYAFPAGASQLETAMANLYLLKRTDSHSTLMADGQITRDLFFMCRRDNRLLRDTIALIQVTNGLFFAGNSLAEAALA